MEKNGKHSSNTQMEDTKTVAANGDDIHEEEPEFNYRGVKTMPFIIGNETFEKLGAIGAVSNLQVYLTTVFNMSRLNATTLLNVFNGTTNIATLIGAYLSDTYFGRYKTLGFASVASFFGLLLITLTAVFKKLHPPHCEPTGGPCISADAGQMAVLLAGFGLMVVGAGGIRPCNFAFGADQFNPNTESGKRGVDSFFNWYYFTVTFAEIISVTLVVYVQSNVSWSIGLAIPTIFMFFSCFMFFVGSKLYVKLLPEGSPMTRLVQVMVVSFKKRNLKLPKDDPCMVTLFNYTPPKSINSKLPHTDQFSFLDKAAIQTPEDKINPNGSAANPWNLCTMQHVEELKCVIRVIPISLTSIIYHIGAQQQYVIFQALQSNRHLGNTSFQIPAASYVIFAMLSLSLWLVIYDRIMVPLLRKHTKTGGITVLQRIGIGLFVTIIESFLGAYVEERRRVSAGGNLVISPMSAMWLVPQLALGGMAEAFNAIGQIEFFYKQFPENMRSIAGAFFFCGNAVSNYVYSFMISEVHKRTGNLPGGNWLPEDLNKGRLDYWYYFVGVLCVLNFVYFLLCAHWYRYKGASAGQQGVESSLEMEESKLDKHFA